MDLSLMNKLRLLRIDTELRPEIKMKPMSRFYFITSTNPNEQFFVFASTAAWLIRKTGDDFEQPHEEDDTNSIIAAIIDVLRDRGIAIDFSSHKLKQGFGEQVCYILNVLANQALKEEQFVWEKLEVKSDDADNIEQVEDEAEIILDKVEEEMAIYSEESEGENYIAKETVNVGDKVHDWEAWQLELERVAPALRVKISADRIDWRARHAQMRLFKEDLFKIFKTTEAQLNKLYGNVTPTLDKVAAREDELNERFEPLVREYRILLDELNKETTEYKDISVGVIERQGLLNELTAKLESVKQKTESKGSCMNDNSPLVSAKKALASIKKEIQELDFQIIVLLWFLTSKETPNNSNLLGNMQSRMVTTEAY